MHAVSVRTRLLEEVVVGDGLAGVLVDAHDVPEVGVDGEEDEGAEHEAEDEGAGDGVQPVGVVLVAVAVRRRVHDRLVHKQPQQRRRADELDRHVKRQDVDQAVPRRRRDLRRHVDVNRDPTDTCMPHAWTVWHFLEH